MDSLWKVGRKRGWWRGVRGGDVLVFVVGLAVLNVVGEVREGVVEDGGVRVVMRVLRGEGEVGLRGGKGPDQGGGGESAVNC